MLLVVAGVVVVLSALVYGGIYVNVPYSEPTPEQAARQARHDLVFERLFGLGVAMSLVGGAGNRGRPGTAPMATATAEGWSRRMTGWRKILLSMAAPGLVAMVIGACAEGGDRTPTDEPSGTDGQLPAPRHPDVILSVQETPGGFAEDASQADVPRFELWADGTVFRIGGGTLGIDRYRLTDTGVSRAKELAGNVSYDPRDYGEPTVTDLGTTSIYTYSGNSPEGVSVYALGEHDGLSGRQRRAHDQLVAVLDALDDLAEDDDLVADPPAPYMPTSLDVAFEPTAADDGGLPEPVAWPLAEPLTERPLALSETGRSLCTTIDGPDAVAVAQLIDEGAEHGAASGQPWSTGAATGSGRPTEVMVTVTGLLPGDEGCSRRQPEATRPITMGAGRLNPVELVDPEEWDGQLPGTRFETATALEVYAAVPILARATEERAATADDPDSSVLAPTGARLSYYHYRAVASDIDGRRHLDIEARHQSLEIEGMGEPDPFEPETWRARIDLSNETVTDLVVDP